MRGISKLRFRVRQTVRVGSHFDRSRTMTEGLH